MITEKALHRALEKCYDASTRLYGALSELGEMASEIYGEELQADMCGGDEIEFRHVDNTGMAHAFDCVRIEDILNRLHGKKDRI